MLRHCRRFHRLLAEKPLTSMNPSAAARRSQTSQPMMMLASIERSTVQLLLQSVKDLLELGTIMALGHCLTAAAILSG
jgi:hypothetical protein